MVKHIHVYQGEDCGTAPKFPADYIEHAFRMAIGDGDIERMPHPSGKEWYRVVPVEDLDGRLQKEDGSWY
jgi:hypothetical protein